MQQSSLMFFSSKAASDNYLAPTSASNEQFPLKHTSAAFKSRSDQSSFNIAEPNNTSEDASSLCGEASDNDSSTDNNLPLHLTKETILVTLGELAQKTKNTTLKLLIVNTAARCRALFKTDAPALTLNEPDLQDTIQKALDSLYVTFTHQMNTLFPFTELLVSIEQLQKDSIKATQIFPAEEQQFHTQEIGPKDYLLSQVKNSLLKQQNDFEPYISNQGALPFLSRNESLASVSPTNISSKLFYKM